MGRTGKIALVAFAGALLGSAAGLAYTHLSTREHTVLLRWDDTAVVARGQALYIARCASCHGTLGEGRAAAQDALSPVPSAPAHDASGHTWQHPDFALVQLTKAGESTVACRTLDENAMPKFERELSDRQIVEVLSYIKSTWPAEIRAKQEKVNRLYTTHNATMRDLLDLPES